MVEERAEYCLISALEAECIVVPGHHCHILKVAISPRRIGQS
jgi:hypothetical protein